MRRQGVSRELGLKPKVPRRNKHPEWHLPVEVRNNRLFAVLTILEFIRKKVALTSNWRGRLTELFQNYPEIPMDLMGFPDDWEQCRIWSDR